MHRRESLRALLSSGIRIPELLSLSGRGEAVALRECLTHSFSLLSSSLKSLARTRAGSASRAAPLLKGDLDVDEPEEDDGVFGIKCVELLILLLAVCSVFVLNIGAGLITFAVLIVCMEDVEVFISFWAVWVDTRGDTLRGNIFCV